jgi:uncharacterized protein (TIGR00369 family)
MITMDRTRTIRWRDPTPAFEALGRMPGLDYLRALMEGELPMAPIMALLGARLTELERGRAVLELDPDEHHYNALGMVHGGIAATLCDTAMGCAIQTLLPAGTGYATTDLKVSYFRPLDGETGRVTCEGTVLHLGRRTAAAEGRLVDPDGRLCAHATCTCLVMGPTG